MAGGGSADGRCSRRLGSTGGPATSSDYGDGGRSSIQTSGEDILIAEEGGEGGEEASSSKKEKQIEEEKMKHRSLPDSDLISSHSSSSSSSRRRSLFGACNGQHSNFFDPTFCGRGGSRIGQLGLAAIELLPLTAALGVTKLMDDANLSSPSASTSPPPTSASITAQPANPLSVTFMFLILFLPVALCVVVFTCYVRRLPYRF